TLTEGFSHFVTSMTAPVASGWSVHRVGFTPTGKAPPYHGAHPLLPLRHRQIASACIITMNKQRRCRVIE
ncbi:MAG: hypothetical protein ACR2QH_02615, partial [Geminicoccaceae bacterium]